MTVGRAESSRAEHGGGEKSRASEWLEQAKGRLQASNHESESQVTSSDADEKLGRLREQAEKLLSSI
eukprot:8196076-Pyramimonas_sp.AAC.1